MSIRTKVLGLVDVMMRVPPILVIDEILKIGMGLPTRYYPNANITTETNSSTIGSSSSNIVDSNSTSSSIIDDNAKTYTLEAAVENATIQAVEKGMLSLHFGAIMDELVQDTDISNVLTLASVKFIICIIGFLCASCIFMLWTRHLVMVYMFVISLGLTFLSYWSNVSALTLMENSPCILEDVLSLNATRLLDSGGVVMALVPHLVAQWFMGMLFAYIHLGPRYALLQKMMPFIFAAPILLGMLPIPSNLMKYTPLSAAIVPLALTKVTLFSSAMEAGKTVYNGYQYAMNFISNFGLSALIENEWTRLNVPSVLRVFWTIRISQEFYAMAMAESLSSLSVLPTMQKLLVDGCETLTAVLGMTSVISAICHYIGKAFQWYLLTFDSDEEKSLGTVSAVLFYILALQTGLTSLSPDKRFVRLCRNLCLLVTALLHFLHNIVSPILMSLSAARNPSRKRHMRALSVCAFLVIAPIGLLTALWTRHSPSTWLLAVTAFSVEVVVKVLVSLATYTLFLLDARRQSFWEKLDDYLYYVRAFGNSVEFCFGILLFFNGAWILIFESAQNATGGAIRAIMMCIHAYFNIWCEARAGWSVFMKRRSAVHKISALPEATPAQLRAFDDVCAICYQEMYSAKITRCRHYFHGVCLRKWLYVQDRCPLCHEIMMYNERSEATEEPNNEQQQQHADHEMPNPPATPTRRELPANPNAATERLRAGADVTGGGGAGGAVGVAAATSTVTSSTQTTTTSSSNDNASNTPSTSATTAAAFSTAAAASNTTGHTFQFQANVASHD